MRPLGFGEIVDGALQVYRRDFGLYYLIALVATFPGYVLLIVSGVDASALSTGSEGSPLEAMAGALPYLGVSLVGAFIAWIGWIAVGAAMVERIGERPAALGRAFRDALRHLPSTLGATVVALIVFAVLIFVVIAGGGVIMAAFSGLGSATLLILSTLFVFLAGALVTAFWMGATFGILPAVIIEGRDAMSALGRSLSLCRGAWLRVIGIMVVAMIINVAPSIGVTALFGMGNLFTSPDALGEISSTQQWLLNTIDLVVAPLTTPFMVGSILVLFHDRRVRSEAYDLETLAEAMDGR